MRAKPPSTSTPNEIGRLEVGRLASENRSSGERVLFPMPESRDVHVELQKVGSTRFQYGVEWKMFPVMVGGVVVLAKIPKGYNSVVLMLSEAIKGIYVASSFE